jgi:hypothetical protein
VNGNSGRKPNGNSGRSEHWNRQPDSVLYNKALSFAARCVYSVLAGSVHQGTVAVIGQRRIAKLLGCHQETVSAALLDLAQYGHIVIVAKGKQRHIYHLTSDVFGQKQKSGEETLVSKPRRRFATVKDPSGITPTTRQAASAASLNRDEGARILA